MTPMPEHDGRAFYAGLLEAMIEVMGTAKGYLFRHGPRMAMISLRLGRRLGLSSDELARLFFAGVLCDTGMIGLMEDAHALGFHRSLFHRSLVRSPRDLLPDEVSPLTIDQLLLIFASMVDAKDHYTAGHSRRVARLAHTLAEHIGLDEIAAGAGAHFAPGVADAFLDLPEDVFPDPRPASTPAAGALGAAG